MKLPCVGDTRAAPSPAALQPGAIDQRAGRRRDAVRHAIDRRIRILEDAAGARGFERLGALPIGERFARDGAQRSRLSTPDAKIRGEHDLARALQAAAVVAELHVAPPATAAKLAINASTTSTLSTSSPISRPLKCALP